MKPLSKEEADKFRDDWFKALQNTGNCIFFDSESKMEFTRLKKYRLPRKKKKALKKWLDKYSSKPLKISSRMRTLDEINFLGATDVNSQSQIIKSNHEI